MHITGERRCIACREHALSQEMIRISKSADGIIIGDKKKINGRGVYVHKKSECIEQVCRRKLLNKTFSTNVGEEIYNNLRGYIEQV